MEIPSCKWCRNVKTESFEGKIKRLKTQMRKKRKKEKRKKDGD